MNKIFNYLVFGLISLFFIKSTAEVNAAFKSNFILDNEMDDIYAYAELKKVEIVIPEEVEEVVDPCLPRSLEQLQGKKLLAFTFDDGPNNKTTLELLEGLKKFDARVTFFMLGSRVSRHQESLIAAYEQCNQIGNHTYSHYNLLKKDIKTIENEINDTNLAIYNIIGEYPTLIRPPYGNTNKDIKEIGNLPTILWSIDTLDWKYRNADRIANEIIENAEDGAIVLLHDIYSTSVEGALIAMEELKDEYAFVTIEEMALIKEIELNFSKSYSKFK